MVREKRERESKSEQSKERKRKREQLLPLVPSTIAYTGPGGHGHLRVLATNCHEACKHQTTLAGAGADEATPVGVNGRDRHEEGARPGICLARFRGLFECCLGRASFWPA